MTVLMANVMFKEYTLQGLCCPNCAMKIEDDIKMQSGVVTASVNIINSTLKVEFEGEPAKDIATTIKKIVHTYEPDIVVIEKGDHIEDGPHSHDHSHDDMDAKKKLIMVITGALIFSVGIIFQYIIDSDQYILFTIFLISYIILGGQVVWKAAKNITKGQIFDENSLMSIATIGAFIIGNYPEAVAVMLFYQIGDYFQNVAVRRSKKSITDLMDIRPDYANLKIGNELKKVAPDTVHIGDIIIVKPGEKIPLDGVIIEGESTLDMVALTGESIPRKASVPDTVLSGCINQSGVLTIEVTKPFSESTVAKIVDLVENASSKKAPTENFITTFARYYTPAVVLLAIMLAAIPPLFFGGMWMEWINRGLIFLVISCPCALVVSIPLGFFGGIGGASKKGILVKGSNYLEALNDIEIVVFDKTGTLTKGVFAVTKLIPANGYSNEVLLETAASAEAFSNHPIALSVMQAYGKEIEKEKLSNYMEISGHGICASIDDKTIFVGNNKLMQLKNIDFIESYDIGTKIYVAINGIFAGCIVISDEIKADSRGAIAKLKAKGVRKTVMLTGDNVQIAEAIAKELQLDEVYASLLPDQKVEKVEMLHGQKSPKGKLVFVGDGINDAPVLARADVGIAMGGLGSDAAIEAADVVLMTDEPSKLAEAIDIAKFTRRIVWQNIVFALGVKGIVLLLGAFGIATMWEAVFADVGVSLLAILNATRIMR